MTDRDLNLLRLAAAYGALQLFEARDVHMCPWCSWSVLHDGMDPEGLEEVLRDHFDTDHPGWTIEKAEAALASAKGASE